MIQTDRTSTYFPTAAAHDCFTDRGKSPERWDEIRKIAWNELW